METRSSPDIIMFPVLTNRRARPGRDSRLEDRLAPATLLASVFPPDLTGPQPFARFGEAVAIGANYAVVGAPAADVGGVSDAGQAFVYESATKALVASLSVTSPAAVDNFGAAVAVVGSYVLVGAPGRGLGAAYLYDMSAPGRLRPRRDVFEPQHAQR
jgi:hypothetical protein